MEAIVLGLVLLCLLGGSAFFSSAEVAMFSLNALQLRRLRTEQPRLAQTIQAILHPPTRFLSTILIGNTLINVLWAIFGYAWLERYWPHQPEWWYIALLTLGLLLFGEVLPKRCAFLWPLKLARVYAWPLQWTMRGLTPLRRALEIVTQPLAKAFRAQGHALSDDEFETVLELSTETGVLEPGEDAMLKSVLRLDDLQARDVMTPRVDLVGYDCNADPAELLHVARETRMRQLVLYRGDLDRVEGLLDIRAYLLDPQHRMQAARLPLWFVPESAPLDKLLRQFITGKKRAAVVVDEYGGTAGLITRGDILEEITGDIDDEHADHRLLFESAGENRWVLDGQVSLEEINARLDAELDAEGVDRLAGWIATRLERLPRPGDTAVGQGFQATVQQMRRHRVTLVQLKRLAAAAGETVS